MTGLLLKEFAECVGVPYGTVKRWVHEGMPVVRCGRAVNVIEKDARAWMKERGRRGKTNHDTQRTVYFAQREDGAIKIGWSDRPRGRVYELRSRYKCEVAMLSSHRASRRLERRLQAHFASARMDGEWFAATPELQTLARLQDSAAWVSVVQRLGEVNGPLGHCAGAQGNDGDPGEREMRAAAEKRS